MLVKSSSLNSLSLPGAWWGKLLGGAFGFMLGGPLGAFIGAALGHNFDAGMRGSARRRAESSPFGQTRGDVALGVGELVGGGVDEVYPYGGAAAHR